MRLAVWILVLALLASAGAAVPPATQKPVRVVLDLNVGDTQTVSLSNGASAKIHLVDYTLTRDSLRDAVRDACVVVEVNGAIATLGCGNYNLPVTVGGAQIDCSILRPYNGNTNRDQWALEKDARLRVWPAGSPLMERGTFGYPLKQKWLATGTQMANEPTFVDGGEDPRRKRIYYHNDLDFGGCEGLTEVVAATDGTIVALGKTILPGYEDTPAVARYDGVFVLDERGWFHRYLHLQSFDPALQLGGKVRCGQKIGILGKEGDSGGWSHLHYGISALQPSGKWGTEEAYAYVAEAYRAENAPALLAVARPHQLVRVGEKAVLDGTRSWSADGKPLKYEWTLTGGAKSDQSTVERTYAKPGEYTEILKITDSRGNVAYDFAVVLVDGGRSPKLPPAIHPTYWPTMGIKPGETVTFKVRTFNTTHGVETWNFGDGSAPLTTKSDGGVIDLAKDGYAVTTHAFAKAGIYIVTVERDDETGAKATGRLAVEVAAR